jgi:hypothetical protein
MATDMVFFKIFIVFWCNMSCLLKIEENSQEGSANSLFSGCYFKTMHCLAHRGLLKSELTQQQVEIFSGDDIKAF